MVLSACMAFGVSLSQVLGGLHGNKFEEHGEDSTSGLREFLTPHQLAIGFKLRWGALRHYDRYMSVRNCGQLRDQFT